MSYTWLAGYGHYSPHSGLALSSPRLLSPNLASAVRESSYWSPSLPWLEERLDNHSGHIPDRSDQRNPSQAQYPDEHTLPVDRRPECLMMAERGPQDKVRRIQRRAERYWPKCSSSQGMYPPCCSARVGLRDMGCCKCKQRIRKKVGHCQGKPSVQHLTN